MIMAHTPLTELHVNRYISEFIRVNRRSVRTAHERAIPVPALCLLGLAAG